jgi:hypothetical protein
MNCQFKTNLSGKLGVNFIYYEKNLFQVKWEGTKHFKRNVQTLC